MNSINTVGDLKKALSAYEDSIPFDVVMLDGSARKDPIRGGFNNDTMIYRETRVTAVNRECDPRLVISAIAYQS